MSNNNKGEAADRGSLPPRGGVGFGVGLALQIFRLTEVSHSRLTGRSITGALRPVKGSKRDFSRTHNSFTAVHYVSILLDRE